MLFHIQPGHQDQTKLMEWIIILSTQNLATIEEKVLYAKFLKIITELKKVDKLLSNNNFLI